MAATNTPTRTIKVPMAGLELGQAPDVLETLLGSCIGIAVWDPSTGLGGLAHVMLPCSNGATATPGKFADTATAELKRRLLARGANPLCLRAKLAGGATMYGEKTAQDIGIKNYRAAVQGLQREKIALSAEDIGGTRGRIIHFSLSNGRLCVTVQRGVAVEV
jgi:chemotaxis protein CheD